MFAPALAKILLGVSAALTRQAAYAERRRLWADKVGRPYPTSADQPARSF